MTSESRKADQRVASANYRAKTKVKLKSFDELLAALKKQTKASQELINQLEIK